MNNPNSHYRRQQPTCLPDSQHSSHHAKDTDDKMIAGSTQATDVSSTHLLPTKVFEVETPNGSTTERAFSNATVRWTAQPVLDWIGSLAAATENGDGKGILDVGGIQLSTPSARMPPPPAPTSAPTLAATSSMPPYHHDASAKDGGGSGKRVYPTESHTRLYAQAKGPRQWDLTYVCQRDPVGASHFCEKLYPVAVEYEESFLHHDSSLKVDYYNMQDLLAFKFDRILDQADVAEESRRLLDLLYTETLQKMQALVTQEVDKNAPAAVPSLDSVKSIASAPKKDFSKHMTNWLRDNWTNPYPDEKGLVELSTAYGTTTTVVSNWLINARTRKWRPAIVKATNLGRPCDLLLEDSINIFDGTPLRDLEDVDNVQDDEQEDTSGESLFYRPTKRVRRNTDGY